jgi:DDE superfamily endonuclease
VEDIAVATFLASSFGTFVMQFFQHLFPTPSRQTFGLLAGGWALASGRHTITADLWVTGAAPVKHFARFYVFLGSPFYTARWQVWAGIIRPAASLVPAESPIILECDDTTKKKAGPHLEGVARYRNGAGSARQESRTLRGLHFVLGVMRVPLPQWPGHCVTVPIGLALYRQAVHARQRARPYRSRSALARQMVDVVAAQLPNRAIRVLADGGYATQEFLRALPGSGEVVSRFLVSGQLSALPPQPTGHRGRPPQKGALLGSPKTWAGRCRGWQPHPTATGAEVHAGLGLWHTVLPGRLLRVVVIRRPAAQRVATPAQSKSLPAVEACFTTELALSPEAILQQYRDRWAVEITRRDSNAFDGLGQDQCRKVPRRVGANTLRLVRAAARPLWFVAHVNRTEALPLCRYRPWYRQKCAPSQLDIVCACREALHEAGVFPVPRFAPEVAENPEALKHTLPIAA